MMKHLKDRKVGYWEHWLTAMKCSVALYIHAWFPFIFEDYTSKHICKKEHPEHTYPDFVEKFYKK